MLEVRGLTVAYGAEPVLEKVDLDVPQGGFVSLVGPSGSGKSTVLRAVTRLLKPAAGDIRLEVEPREVGFLFQDDALLPWRTARQNVALGLRIRGIATDKALGMADEWLGRLSLAGLEGRYPRQLSGGQRKRVALAQVLALRPRLLLMDEPFASLDAIVRARITQDVLRWVEHEHL
ncbi:MAG TPA: ABC transporter ATP-binding protein, partial [Candidatus Omnitrophota bacterium]|nr:ABC transporter ATP-binding protein [Candidatus Omnitrophota bacterium]